MWRGDKTAWGHRARQMWVQIPNADARRLQWSRERTHSYRALNSKTIWKSSCIVLLTGEKVDIHAAAIRIRKFESEIASCVEEKQRNFWISTFSPTNTSIATCEIVQNLLGKTLTSFTISYARCNYSSSLLNPSNSIEIRKYCILARNIWRNDENAPSWIWFLKKENQLI